MRPHFKQLLIGTTQRRFVWDLSIRASAAAMEFAAIRSAMRTQLFLFYFESVGEI
jgi:hypothetical protein